MDDAIFPKPPQRLVLLSDFTRRLLKKMGHTVRFGEMTVDIPDAASTMGALPVILMHSYHMLEKVQARSALHWFSGLEFADVSPEEAPLSLMGVRVADKTPESVVVTPLLHLMLESWRTVLTPQGVFELSKLIDYQGDKLWSQERLRSLVEQSEMSRPT